MAESKRGVSSSVVTLTEMGKLFLAPVVGPQRTSPRALDRFVLHVLGVIDIRGLIVERFTRLEGYLFVLAAPNLPDGIVPTVIPGDASFAIHQSPRSARRSYALLGHAVLFESNEEVSATALADFPFADEVSAGRHRRRSGSSEFDPLNLALNSLVSAILVNDIRGSLQVDTGNFARRERLMTAVFEDDHDGVVIVSEPGCCG